MKPKVLSDWETELEIRLPTLPDWAQRGLAEWSFGIATTQYCGTNTVSAFIAAVTSERPNTVRQRLREFYQEAARKRGPGRTAFAAEAQFADLLRWAWSLREPGQTTIALALDATSLRDVFTVLSFSVLVSGCAIPVAWQVMRAGMPGAYRPAIERLVALLAPAVPAGVDVVVAADRGLYAPWLFTALTAQGWHPFLRINTQGTYCALGDDAPQALADLVPAVGQTFAASVRCFAAHPLDCTLVARRDAVHAQPWVIVTDLPPDAVDAAWYGVRSWIEAGFKDLKRGGLHWHQSRLTDPAHAERQWLALSVALLWMVSLGSDPPADPAGKRPLRRLLSVARLGMIRFLAALVNFRPHLPTCLDFNWRSGLAPP